LSRDLTSNQEKLLRNRRKKISQGKKGRNLQEKLLITCGITHLLTQCFVETGNQNMYQPVGKAGNKQTCLLHMIHYCVKITVKGANLITES